MNAPATPADATFLPASVERQRIVAVINQKGGVGKTTVTLGLASAAMAAGRRTLVLDLDPQGASSWVLGVDEYGVDDEGAGHDGAGAGSAAPTMADVFGGGADPAAAIRPSSWSPLVDILPAGPRLQEFEEGDPERLATALGSLTAGDAPRYDAVLIDCPPSLGNLTVSGLAAARHAVIVVEPSALGLRGIGGVADVVDEIWDAHNPDLELSGVVLNRVPSISSEAERRIEELARIVGRNAIWKPAVPQRVVFSQAVGERRPIHAYGARATDPIDAFDRLWRKLARKLSAG